jgi:hypothetical protein
MVERRPVPTRGTASSRSATPFSLFSPRTRIFILCTSLVAPSSAQSAMKSMMRSTTARKNMVGSRRVACCPHTLVDVTLRHAISLPHANKEDAIQGLPQGDLRKAGSWEPLRTNRVCVLRAPRHTYSGRRVSRHGRLVRLLRRQVDRQGHMARVMPRKLLDRYGDFSSSVSLFEIHDGLRRFVQRKRSVGYRSDLAGLD